MSGSITVRFSRGRWICDVSEYAAGKRQRVRKVFGKGREGKLAAEAYTCCRSSSAGGPGVRCRAAAMCFQASLTP
jgi:hypothetical protein